MEEKKDSKEGGKDGKEDVKWFTIKNATDLQRVRLEKLMKNPVTEKFSFVYQHLSIVNFPFRARK